MPEKLPRGEFALGALSTVITLPLSMTDLSYGVKTVKEIGTVVWIKDESLSQAGKDCELGIFYNIDKTKIGENDIWTEEKLRAAAEGQNDAPPQVKEFNDSYLVFEPSQSTCMANNRLQLWKAVQTAERQN